MTELTRYQARSLARAVGDLRASLGGNHTWDTPGIEDALWQARELAPPHVLAIAAIRAAMDPGNRTPAIIGKPGKHWRESETAARFPEPHDGERCSICYERESRCVQVWSEDHRFQSVKRTKELAEIHRQRATGPS